MNTNATNGNCQRNCWLIALAVGIVVALYLMLSAGWGAFWSLVIGLAILMGGGLLLTRKFCVASEMQGGAAGAAPVAAPTPAPTPAPKHAPTPEPAAAPEPEPEPTPEPEPASEPAATPAASDTGVRPSTPLPGQQELAARRGSWRYQGADMAAPAASQPADAPAAGAPEGLAAARAGGADDLKMIKGVGPKLEKLLNSMGYFHFDQIAGWSASDIAWVDDNLAGFKGRVSRDNWVEQARRLAAGEETEFAQRAKHDGIYD